MNRARSVLLYVLLASVLAGLLGCATPTAAPTVPPAASSPAAAKPTEKPAAQPPAQAKSLVIDMIGDPATLDPGLQYDSATYGVYRNIYDTFLARDPKSGQIQGRLAKSWKNISPTEWEFVLQSGVKFHNGDPFSAEDVKYSIDRILDKDYKSPQNQNFNAIKEVKIVDPNTVRIITTDPYPVLLAQLVNLSIVPAKYTKEKGSQGLSAAPIGTGAYVFEEWKKAQYVSLKANDSYWRGKPAFASVRFRAVPEPSTRVADLQAGTADLITGIDVDLAKQVESKSNLKVLTVDTERVGYLAFNTLGSGPSKKPEVRQAMAYAINPKALVDAFFGGKANQVTGFLTPLHVGFDPNLRGYTYDLAKAKELLSKAGYASGVDVVFLTSQAYDQKLVQAIQGQLAQAGINAKITLIDHPTYLKMIQSPQHDWGDVRFGLWSCSCLDADGVIQPLFRSGTIWSSYSSPAYDQLVDQARSTIDEAKRKDAYAKASKILNDDAVGLGLWQGRAFYAARADLTWTPTVDEQLQVFDMK